MSSRSGRVRYISRRDTSFDRYLAALVAEEGFGAERFYIGITSEERADTVRRRLKRAGAHLNPPVSVRAFWFGCHGCQHGGPECRYHVSFTAYDPAEARAWKLAHLTEAQQGRGR